MAAAPHLPSAAGHAAAERLAARLATVHARVPQVWLAHLLDGARASRWLPVPGSASPTTGRATTPPQWAVLVFHGLLRACGGRAASARGRALAFDLAAAVVPLAVRGTVAARAVPEEVQRSRWARELLRGARPAEAAQACLLALEATGALLATPAMVEQARWRLGPGAQATDAQAIASVVAEVVYRCHEDAGALLAAVAAQACR
jgi:hypothetical protein